LHIDDDYESGIYDVTLAAGVISKSVIINIKDDRLLEINEEFEVTILSSSLPSTLISGSPNIALMTIIDDDCKLSRLLFYVLINFHTASKMTSSQITN